MEIELYNLFVGPTMPAEEHRSAQIGPFTVRMVDDYEGVARQVYRPAQAHVSWQWKRLEEQPAGQPPESPVGEVTKTVQRVEAESGDWAATAKATFDESAQSEQSVLSRYPSNDYGIWDLCELLTFISGRRVATKELLERFDPNTAVEPATNPDEILSCASLAWGNRKQISDQGMSYALLSHNSAMDYKFIQPRAAQYNTALNVLVDRWPLPKFPKVSKEVREGLAADRKLQGLQAVQTLSRLNRTCSGKEDTFVLDFANDAEDVQEAFKPFYERTEIEQATDPNLLYTLKTRLDDFQIYWKQEIEDFAKVFFKPQQKQREQDKGLLHKHIDPAVTRYRGETEETQADFKHHLASYLRLYSFMSQMMNFHDADLEKLYAYGRLLITKLTDEGGRTPFTLDDEVRLAYYRLQRTGEGSASLQPGDTATVAGPTSVGTGRPREEDIAKLSDIVTVLNDRFATDFRPEDQLLFDQVVGDLTSDDGLADQAKNNDLEQFGFAFDPKAMATFMDRMERNENIANVFMENEDVRKVILDWMKNRVYEELQKDAG